MFERPRFSGLPGGALAAELEAVDPCTLDDDDLAAYLQAANRLEAWSGSLKARGDPRVRPQPRAARTRR